MHPAEYVLNIFLCIAHLRHRSLHCFALCRIERTAPMHWGKALNEFHAYLILALHASLIFAYPWPSDHICLCNPDQAIMTSDQSGIAGAMLHFDIGSLYSLKIQGLYRTQKWKEGCEMSFFVQTTLKLWQGRRIKVCAPDTYTYIYAEVVGKKSSVRDSAGLKLFWWQVLLTTAN